MTAGNPDQPTPAGMLIIDKPEGPTSMKVCAIVRAKLRNAGAPKRIKVGHAGTLDPLATGVLVLLIGKATKAVNTFMATDKRYTATIDLSAFTTTDDREGERTEITVERPPERAAISTALESFTGEIMQRPPAFSAMKIGGRRAYALARNAQTPEEMPEMKPRPVQINTIDITDYAWPSLTLDIRCGKGTYIRSIARDLGEHLGTGGSLTALRRTEVGDCTIDRAIALNNLPETLTQSDLTQLDAGESASA